MELAVVTRFLALLALAAGLIAVGATIGRILGDRAPAVLRPDVTLGRRGTLTLAGAIATVSTLGSLYYSEVALFTPCRLCWYQRIAMYPLALMLPVAAWRDDAAVKRYGLLLAVIGGVIAAYHYLLQWFPQLDAGACDPTAPCAAFYVREFGFVSIPFMALMGFAAITVLLLSIPSRPETP